ncbi:translation initiation factor IF-2 subunit beta [Candidatus Woesearchaeota archaeon]|nr:MAG: translation initiation factor IF-2 subunit beta [Candidatus Woesearchaeota archaeon]
MDYVELLKRARDQLPESVFEKERFEIPKVRGHIEGNKTVIVNFQQIAGVLRRPVDHLLKYVLKELATPGDIKKSGLLVLGSKIPASRINEKIRRYAHDFVLCPDCGKPDTEISKETGGLSYLKCSACGAKHPVKSKI